MFFKAPEGSLISTFQTVMSREPTMLFMFCLLYKVLAYGKFDFGGLRLSEQMEDGSTLKTAHQLPRGSEGRMTEALEKANYTPYSRMYFVVLT